MRRDAIRLLTLLSCVLLATAGCKGRSSGGGGNEAPTITSSGGGDTAAVTAAESSTAVVTVRATDAEDDPTDLDYSISAGADQALFDIDPASGELVFLSAPDFANPQDADMDNVYEVQVQVQDRGGAVDQQDLSVQVGFAVDTTNDVDNGDLSLGDRSLREALGEVSAGDAISFVPALSGQTIVLSGAPLPILMSVTVDGDLDGDDTPDVTVDGDLASRLFTIDDGNRSPDRDVELVGLRLTRGEESDDGGAILNRENLTLRYCDVFDNATTGRNNDGGAISNGNGALLLHGTTLRDNSTNGDNSEGGGIFNVTGSVTLVRSTVSGNATTVANSEGGGIFTVNGDLTVRFSRITDNSTEGNNGEGGGIFNQNSSLTIDHSTVDANFTLGVGSEGGGIYTDTELSNVIGLISNSTISSNDASADGGGVYNFDGLLRVRNATITQNDASGLAAGLASFGDANTTTEFVSSLVAGNMGNDIDLVEGATLSVESLGTNVVGTGNALADFDPAEVIGAASPELGPLADNGGQTPTHELLSGSPALDAGSNPDALDTDQREFDRTVGPETDVGAYEAD